ncbi:uncharacterized protein LOC135463857 [Liolophura sinensis]|uniref:uncharacterized protein LOC135463857 n=1 Tax=Liolophura sinensis TaxID=3198878 RepID=UPI0031588973
MGVSLERVQNKFACIIGELCSEPVILSKFAIWLDLRLAEYKAKGAISLDCSGENPDPGWLKGHEKPACVREDHYPYDHPLSRSAGNVHMSGSGSVSRTDDRIYDVDDSLTDDRLEPDVVVVKEESDVETPELFPVSLHRVDPSLPRKRHGPEHTPASSYHTFSQSPAKVGRFSETLPSTTEDESANQSLISIISKAKDNDPVTNMHLPSTVNFNPDLPSDQGLEPAQSMGDNSVSFSPQHLSTSSTPQHINISPSASVDDSSSFQMASLQSLDSELPFPQNSGFSPAQPMLSGSGPSPSSTRADVRKDTRLRMSTLALPPHLHREVVRRRILQGIGLKDKNDHVIRNFISVVTALERWWWQTHGEKRRMETLTPTELDTYLCEFYTVLTKPSGEDYDPKSFRAFPTTLDRFLREKNYPVSIQKSPLFCRSQLAYRTRLRKLKEAVELR